MAGGWLRLADASPRGAAMGLTGPAVRVIVVASAMTDDANTPFDSIATAIDAIAAGGLVIMTDDADRENEGDLIMAASLATPESINIMIRHARGLLCVPMTEHGLKRLGIGDMSPANRESFRTAFTVSVDAADGISTGISAHDRARTVRLLADPNTTANDLVQPGHVFPLRARPGGVLERAGHTEGAVDLVSLAGLAPCAAICEVLNEDGSMARLPELIEFRKRFNMPMISVAQMIEYRLARERLVERIDSRPLSSEFGEFTAHQYRSRFDQRIHTVLTLGKLDGTPTLVRVQVENVLSDVFHAQGEEGHASLTEALRQIRSAGRGALVYLQDSDMRVPAEHAVDGPRAKGPGGAASRGLREYGIGAQIMADLGLQKIRLLTSRKRRVVALEGFGLEIVEHVPLGPGG